MIKISNPLIPALILTLVLTACGNKDETPTTAPAQPATATQPVEAAKPVEAVNNEHSEKGEKVFKMTCAMCHQTGAAGAPILGKKDEWAPRIAQGMPILYGHAIKGYTGTKGAMPAKGANASLSDDDVKASVDYMVNKSK